MKVVWSRSARADLDAIQTYMLELNPHAAERIWVRIAERVADLADMPLAYPIDGDGLLRRLIVTRTPYVVLYNVVDDEVRIEAVFHMSRDRDSN